MDKTWMKKVHAAFLLMLILCLIPLFSALASTGTVSASSLNIRAKADSNSNVVMVLRKGAKVTIKETSGSWYKITYNGKTGYAYKTYITVNSSGSSSSSKTTASKSTSSKSTSTKSTSSSDGTCKIGDKGDAVRKVQKRLIALGYLSGSADGSYGNQTANAVKSFQKRNGLSVTGSVNAKTLSKLNSKDAKKEAAGNSDKIKTERLDWFNGGKNRIPKGATFKVKDIWTGKIFTVRRWSGYNHIDAEPLTRSDTNTLKSIYGHWSWKRRPVLVKYNGRVYAGSMNGMPHGTSTISGNGFDGHFCIHFYGSKTHGSGKVDSAHQNCVATAMKYTW